MARDKTISKRPVVERPKLGWSAWEATVGYIAAQYSPDATLRLQVYPAADTAELPQSWRWSAALIWGVHHEAVEEQASLGAALSALWSRVDQDHVIFKTAAAAQKQPTGYAPDGWIDDRTREVMERLLGVTGAVFGTAWRCVYIYQPVDNPEHRVQARLLARQGSVNRVGRGPTLRDACRSLSHNAVALFSSRSRKDWGSPGRRAQWDEG